MLVSEKFITQKYKLTSKNFADSRISDSPRNQPKKSDGPPPLFINGLPPGLIKINTKVSSGWLIIVLRLFKSTENTDQPIIFLIQSVSRFEWKCCTSNFFYTWKIDSPMMVELMRSERGPEITREAKIVNLRGTSSIPIEVFLSNILIILTMSFAIA